MEGRVPNSPGHYDFELWARFPTEENFMEIEGPDRFQMRTIAVGTIEITDH